MMRLNFFTRPIDVDNLNIRRQFAGVVRISGLPNKEVLNSIPSPFYFWTGNELYYYDSNKSSATAVHKIEVTPTQSDELNVQLLTQTVIDSNLPDNELNRAIENSYIQYKTIKEKQSKVIQQITGHTPPPNYPNILFEYVMSHSENLPYIHAICKRHPEYVVTHMHDMGDRVCFSGNTSFDVGNS
jgi:hypothetical protein